MQNKIITLVALVVASAAFDAQALKRATNPRPAGTPVTGTTPSVKPVVTPVITKVVVSDAERAAIIAEMKKVDEKLINKALSLGTQEDANEFLDKVRAELKPTHDAYMSKIDALPSKADLEAKAQEAEFEKRRQERALTATDKAALRTLAKTWNKADVYKNYQAYLDKNNRDWDDMFFTELNGLAKE